MTDLEAAFSQTDSHGSLKASAQFLVFEPGLYTVGINPADSTMGDNGLRLPCVRIDALPPGPASPGKAQVAIMTEAGWLSQSEERGFIRVDGGRASVVVTTYVLPGVMTAPEIHVSQVGRRSGAVASAEVGAVEGAFVNHRTAATAPLSETAEVEQFAATEGPGFKLHVHASVLGDLVGPAGTWVGGDAGHPLEAFSLQDIQGIAAEDIEYQAILGRNWNTPWISGGTLCGSRGIAMPLLGLRIRLLASAAARYDVVYAGRFEGGLEIGPLRNGEACVNGNLVLMALQVSVVARSIDTSPSPAQKERPARKKSK